MDCKFCLKFPSYVTEGHRMFEWIGWGLTVWAVLLLISGLLVLLVPALAPWAVMMALCGAIPTWLSSWNGAKGTALRGALAWAGLTITLGLLAQVQATLELSETGRPWTGRITYLMVLTILASLTSVLGARNPGGRVWAILMVLLVVVFLIPWLEAGGRLRRAQGLGQVQLDSPWTLFYGLLALAGVTNFVPTRYGLAALSLGASLILELLGLTRKGWTAEARAAVWSAVAWSLAFGWWLAEWSHRRPSLGRNSVERLWLWFRDHWGVVWALRIQERFNRSAEVSRWPSRLTWFGLVPASPATGAATEEPPEPAEATLRGLIHRFVAAERVDALLNPDKGDLAIRQVQRDDRGINSSSGHQRS
jgi:hypothetical protein